jgi:hypothetical protein
VLVRVVADPRITIKWIDDNGQVQDQAAGMPTYTITGIAIDRDDVRAHGRDERLGVESFYKGNEFFYQSLRALTGS